MSKHSQVTVFMLIYSCFVHAYRTRYKKKIMLESIKLPIMVKAEVNLVLVALTLMGLVTRLCGINFPKAVVYEQFLNYFLPISV